MTNKPPEGWPSDLPSEQGRDAGHSFSFRSHVWKSRKYQPTTRAPAIRQPFTPEEVEALLQVAIQGPHPAHNVALLSLLLGTGMRVSELAELTWQDFRLDEPVSSVWVYGRKNGRPRLIPIISQLRDALLRYKESAPTDEAEQTHPEVPHQIKVFDLVQQKPHQHGLAGRSERIRAIENHLRRLAQDSKIDLKAGSIALRLRATFIKQYVSQNPGDLAGLARLLGVSLQTAERYHLETSAAAMELYLGHRSPTKTLRYDHSLPYPMQLNGFRPDTDEEQPN